MAQAVNSVDASEQRTPETGKRKLKYHVWSADAEKEAYKAEARALATAGADEAEAEDDLRLDGRVFIEGPRHLQEKWRDSC